MNTILTITSRGVVTIPAAMRKKLGLEKTDRVEAILTPEGVLLRPVVTIPIEIYTAERIAEFEKSEAELSAVLK